MIIEVGHFLTIHRAHRQSRPSDSGSIRSSLGPPRSRIRKTLHGKPRGWPSKWSPKNSPTAFQFSQTKRILTGWHAPNNHTKTNWLKRETNPWLCSTRKGPGIERWDDEPSHAQGRNGFQDRFGSVGCGLAKSQNRIETHCNCWGNRLSMILRCLRTEPGTSSSTPPWFMLDLDLPRFPQSFDFTVPPPAPNASIFSRSTMLNLACLCYSVFSSYCFSLFPVSDD